MADVCDGSCPCLNQPASAGVQRDEQTILTVVDLGALRADSMHQPWYDRRFYAVALTRANAGADYQNLKMSLLKGTESDLKSVDLAFTCGAS
jgi:hypothetical protein